VPRRVSFIAHAVGALRNGISLRRHAGDRFEHTVKVEAAHACRIRQRIEAWQLVRRLDEPAGFCDRGRLPLGQAWFIRPAAPARSKARAFGFGASLVKADILAPRQPRRAGRPAIDAGGAHRIEKRAVGSAVALPHRLPADVVA